MEEFFGVEGASKDPSLRYIPGDPVWMEWQQLLMQQQQMQQQQQAQQQQDQQAQQQQQQDQGEVTSSTDQLIQMMGGGDGAQMTKSENKLPASKRALLYHQRRVIANALEAFEKDANEAIGEIVAETSKLLPTKRK